MAALPLLLLLIGKNVSEPALEIRSSVEEFSSDSTKIIKKLESEGYLNITIKKFVTNNSVVMQVYRGPRYSIAEINIRGSTIRHSILKEDFGIEPGAYFSSLLVEKGLKSILLRHLNNGHPFCRIIPVITNQGPNSVKIELDIKEGPLVNIADFIYKGGKTRSWAVKRSIRFKPGIYAQNSVDHWVSILEDFDYINNITEKIIRSGEDYHLMFEGDELASELIEVGGSYDPDANRLLIILSLKLENLFGTMRRLTLDWESTKKIEIAYREPWLIYPVTIGVDVKDQWFDTLRVTRGELSFSTNRLKFYAGLERGDKSDEFIGVGYNRKLQEDSLGAFVEFVRMLPERSHVKLGSGIRKKIYPLLTGLNFRHTTIDDPDTTDFFQVGGIKTIRGYWHDEFYFQTGGWSNIELKLIDFLFPFFDLAYLDNNWYSSTGLGFVINGKNVGLQIAIGIPIWEPFRTKLHASILGRL